MQTNSNSTDQIFHADFSKNDSIWLTSAYTLRKTVGILGMILPLLLFGFLFIDNGMSNPLESISHYYYTRVSSIFIAILSNMAIFLIIYKGKEPIDLYLSLLAGICALLIVFFPTGNISNICCDTTKTYSVTILQESRTQEIIHYIAAAIFFLALAYMSIFLFTKSNKPKNQLGKMKKIRNNIYVICGILMLLSVAAIMLLGLFQLIPEDVYKANKLTFWFEVIAIESFGFSWLIKGEALFKD